MNSASTPKKTVCNEVRLDARRYIELALPAPKPNVPNFYTYAPKMKGNFSKVERIELTTNDMKAFGEALLNPAPASNARLVAAMKRTKKWK